MTISNLRHVPLQIAIGNLAVGVYFLLDGRPGWAAASAALASVGLGIYIIVDARKHNP